jgi:hypothetical protein
VRGEHAHDHDADDEGARWLALTCEVEREAPLLLDTLGVRGSASEEARLDFMVRECDEDAFFEWLRETRSLLEGSTAPTEDRTRLAGVLAEVYLLLPGFRAPRADELDELRRLRALAA